MQEFLTNSTYVGLVLVLLGTGVGLPIPEDLPLLLAGYLCGEDVIRLEVAIPLAFTAVLGSDCLLYYFGWRNGRHFEDLGWVRRLGVKPERMEKARSAFQRHGGKTLFGARFLPGVRAGVFFAAGAYRVPFWKLLVFDGSAALLSVPTFILLGWWFAESLDRVQQSTRVVQVGAVAIVLLLLATYLGYRWLYGNNGKSPEAGSG
ncbi:DedA family protein [Phycisphaerales bacterium AB-hyl4]|uniref:DedA family protein n=1 Tax=Natronomicrosphaera hydrolytica TaxID=3242702 RepID=A0ABV4U4T8_9BACT